MSCLAGKVLFFGLISQAGENGCFRLGEGFKSPDT